MIRKISAIAAAASVLTMAGFPASSFAGSCGSYSASKAAKDTVAVSAKSECTPCETMTVSAPVKANDIVAVASGAGAFKTLLAAAEAADLVGALQGEGPLTVFAPTDEAFAKLPKGTVEMLLKPENKSMLQAVLLYHVVAGNVMAADVVKLNDAKTLLGQKATITVKGGKVMVDNANVVKTDIAASNGTIHVIDSVILPKNTVQVAEAAGFTTLLAAAQAAGMAETLNAGTFTIFAPTNEAFAALPAGALDMLLKPENRGLLVAVLNNHLVPGNVPAADVLKSSRVLTAAGSSLAVETKTYGGKTKVMVGGAGVVATDVRALNGTIHVIDRVIVPQHVLNALAVAASKTEKLGAAE